MDMDLEASITLPPAFTLMICLAPVKVSISTPEMVGPSRTALTTFVLRLKLKFDIAFARGYYGFDRAGAQTILNVPWWIGEDFRLLIGRFDGVNLAPAEAGEEIRQDVECLDAR